MRSWSTYPQENFRSEAQRVVQRLLHTSNQIASEIGNVANRFGITRQQFQVLRILRAQYPLTLSINAIRSRMLERMPDSSRMVDRLVCKGLILKASSPNDRRSSVVQITEKGLQLLESIDPAVDNSAHLLRGLSEDELNTLYKLLDKIKG